MCTQMLNIYLVSKGHRNSSSGYWLLESGESVMKGELFIVLDSRIDAVIALINLLLKPSQLGPRRRGDLLPIFKGWNVLAKHLLITEILAVQMDCDVGSLTTESLASCTRSSQNRHGG